MPGISSAAAKVIYKQMVEGNRQGQVCYPIVAKIFELKFEGEKEPRKVIHRTWKECERPAAEHITDYVDPKNPKTMFVMHRCAEHVEEARVLHEAIEKAKLQDK
jgi:hypothetical protein